MAAPQIWEEPPSESGAGAASNGAGAAAGASGTSATGAGAARDTATDLSGITTPFPDGPPPTVSIGNPKELICSVELLHQCRILGVRCA